MNPCTLRSAKPHLTRASRCALTSDPATSIARFTWCATAMASKSWSISPVILQTFESVSTNTPSSIHALLLSALIFLAGCAGAGRVRYETPEEAYTKGKAYYDEGKYDRAI